MLVFPLFLHPTGADRSVSSQPKIYLPVANNVTDKRQEHSGHGAKSGDGTMSGGETGGATMGGGMGGLGGMDLTNPTISSLISTALNWGSGILPELPLYKIEHLVPTVKKPGVTRVQMLFGPLVIQTPAVCSPKCPST